MNFNNDIERKRKRTKFLATYGDPIDGLNQYQINSLWYPTWFTIERMIFCATTLYLWEMPLMILFVRMVLFFMTYIFVATTKLYEDPLTERLELMDQVISILLVDIMILFTELMNEGN